MVKQKKPKGKVKGPSREEEIEEMEEIEELEGTLDYMSTEELVEHMVSLGLNVTEELALELAKREDAVFGTLLICEILSFRDPSVLDDVYSAFDEGWVDTFLIGSDDVEDMLNDEKQESFLKGEYWTSHGGESSGRRGGMNAGYYHFLRYIFLKILWNL
jgi:hypothetical protein